MPETTGSRFDIIKAIFRLGGGSKAQSCDGTFTLGNIPKYKIDGTTTDSGIPAASVVTSSGGTISESQVTNLVNDLAGKVPSTRAINTTAPLNGGGDLSADRTLGVSLATTSAVGVVKPDGTSITVDATGKISAPGSGGGITALTGDVTASGTGSVTATLAVSGVTPGTYTNPTLAIDAKGRVTSAADGASGSLNLPAGAGLIYNGTINPAGGSALAPSLVQSRALTNVSSLAFASNVVAGNLLVVAVGDETVNVVNATISDTLNSTWHAAVSQTGPTSIKMFYTLAPSSGACTVTIAGYTSAGWESIAILEAANAQAALDGTPTGAASGATSPGSITTTGANSLVIVAMEGFHGSTTWTAPSGWAITQAGNHDAVGIAWMVQPNPGTVSPTFTGANTDSDVQIIAAFKAVTTSSFSGGSNNDFYFNTATNRLFGPKSGGVWPSTPITWG